MEAVRLSADHDQHAAAFELGEMPPDWYPRARCLDADPDMFFPAKGEPGTAAVALCESCPVVDACRDYAVQRPELLGVWGATTYRERKRLRTAA